MQILSQRILSVEDWEALIEWLETLEDAQIARQAFADLKVARGCRCRAGWLESNTAKDDLEPEVSPGKS